MTPLAGLSYAQQLENKQKVGSVNIVRMIRRIRKKYIQLNKKMNGGRPVGRGGGDRPMERNSPYDLTWVFHGEKSFPVEPIIHNAQTNEGYRNKCSCVYHCIMRATFCLLLPAATPCRVWDVGARHRVNECMHACV